MNKEQQAIQFLKDYCLYGSSAKYKRNIDVLSKMYKELELYKKALDISLREWNEEAQLSYSGFDESKMKERCLEQARKESKE